MRELRLQFILFFVFLAFLFGFFIMRSFREIEREESRLWTGAVEKTYNQMQARISDFLMLEDARPFSDYNGTNATQPSMLSILPRNDPRGLIGYFQINSDGSFTSPYLAESGFPVPVTQHKQRLNLHRTLMELTKSFQADLTSPQAQEFGGKVTQVTEEKEEKKNENGDVVDLESFTLLIQDAQQDADDKTKKLHASPSDKEEQKQQIYPNPLIQKNTAPKHKELAEPELDATTAAKPVPSLFLDPFRARLVQFKYLIFYRKVWQDQQLYIQGFVVQLDDFFSWLMQVSFDNSDLPKFATAQLELGKLPLVTHGKIFTPESKLELLFVRQLGYPLNQFFWRVYDENLPELPTRRLLTIFTLIVTVTMTGGLFALYRTSAAQVILSQKRQDFVSAVTHELKTPLTAIRMSAEMLREGWVAGEEKKGEYYNLISKESERLSNLIQNVLQMARLEKKNARLNLITESPALSFQEIAKELKTFVEQHGTEWSESIAPDLPKIRFDPDCVKQILYNLVDNSLKFSQYSDTKKIRMELKNVDGKIDWSVSDTGPGIPKKELRKVFEKFYRVENELTRKTKGTGIGLAMAKMMAENMGAQIAAKNLAPQGLCVGLIFKCVILDE